MKHIYLFVIAFLSSVFSFAQCTVSVNDTLLCEPEEIVLHPEVSGYCITQKYAVQVIPFSPIGLTAPTSVALIDDDVAGPFNIGFEFKYFGHTYDEFYIGSNGWVSFSPGQTTNYIPKAIPSDNNVPLNAIMGPWEDWDPSIAGQVHYELVGVAPNRKMVIEFNGVGHFTCGSSVTSLGSFQITLNENDFSIENHILQKPDCDTVRATQGIQNLTGTVAYAVPGRNSTIFSAVNDGVKYIPDNRAHFTWSQGSSVLSSMNSLTLTPIYTGSYIINFHDDLGCFSTDYFNIVIPQIQDPEIQRLGNVLNCNLSGYVYQWYLNGFPIPGGNYQSVILTSFGSYTVSITDTVTGCVYDSRIHLYAAPTDISELLLGEINVFPNPSSTAQLNIALEKELNLSIFNLEGRLISTANLKKANQMLETGLEEGAYFLRFESDNASVTKKWIVL